MDTNQPEIQNENSKEITGVESSSRNRRFLTVAGALIIIFLGISAALYFFLPNFLNSQQNNTPALNTDNQTGKDRSFNSSGKTPDHVVCKNFTSLDEALAEPEIACVLTLSGQNLDSAPQGIYSLTNLNQIDLSNNNISVFPTELFAMEKMISVNLSNNVISEVPSDFILPPTIQLLDLRENNLSTEVLEKYQRSPQ